MIIAFFQAHKDSLTFWSRLFFITIIPFSAAFSYAIVKFFSGLGEKNRKCWRYLIIAIILFGSCYLITLPMVEQIVTLSWKNIK